MNNFLFKPKAETIKEYQHTIGTIFVNQETGKYYYQLKGCCCAGHTINKDHYTGPYDSYVQAMKAMDVHYESDYIPF